MQKLSSRVQDSAINSIHQRPSSQSCNCSKTTGVNLSDVIQHKVCDVTKIRTEPTLSILKLFSWNRAMNSYAKRFSAMLNEITVSLHGELLHIGAIVPLKPHVEVDLCSNITFTELKSTLKLILILQMAKCARLTIGSYSSFTSADNLNTSYTASSYARAPYSVSSHTSTLIIIISIEHQLSTVYETHHLIVFFDCHDMPTRLEHVHLLSTSTIA